MAAQSILQRGARLRESAGAPKGRYGAAGKGVTLVARLSLHPHLSSAMAVCTVAVFVLFPTPTPHGVSKWNAGVLAELSPTEYRHLTPKESGVTSFLFGSFSGHRGMLDTWLCGGQEDTKASCLQTGRRHRSAGTDPGLG